MQLQYGEQFEVQSTTLESLQDNILTMAFDIEDMRQRRVNCTRRKDHRRPLSSRTISLEGEIIVYRHLLDSSGIQEQVVIVTPPESAPSITTRQFCVKSLKKGPISISQSNNRLNNSSFCSL